MSNKKEQVKTNQPSQEEMFKQVLEENSRLRQALQDKTMYEVMDQVRIYVDIFKSDMFTKDKKVLEYITEKVKEVIMPKSTVKNENKVVEEEVKSGF